MDQVPLRVLNRDTASVLARVERGETIEITRHGKVIGRIVPASASELDDLIAEGRIAPARVSGPFAVPPGPCSSSEGGDLIRRLRDEEGC